MKTSKVILNVLMVIMGFAIWFSIYMAYESGELVVVGGSAVDMALLGFVLGIRSHPRSHPEESCSAIRHS
ncbi:MAG: hypothetical protein QXJ75_00895 [Candidatus Bathyarchaeia archaeon]